MTEDHVNDVLMQLFVSARGQLSQSALDRIESHVSQCAECAQRLEDRLTGPPMSVPSVAIVSPSKADHITPAIGQDIAPPSQGSDPVTELISRMQQGDALANEQLWNIVHHELAFIAKRQLSVEPSDHTLDATMLVLEAYLRLFDKEQTALSNRRQFLSAAARQMRLIRVNHAIESGRLSFHGNSQPASLLDQPPAPDADPAEVLAVDEALSRLAQIDHRQAEIVSMRYFTGLSVSETAEVLGLSTRTVANNWRMARAWLHRELSAEPAQPYKLLNQPDRWSRAHEVFDQALTIPKDKREGVLRTACANEPELKLEVEQLLTHDERLPLDFLCPPKSPLMGRSVAGLKQPDPLIGKKVDGFTVKRLIGIGGTANVYEAEQDHPRRIVALKIMRHRLSSHSALERFEREYEIVFSRLHHPNVARVFSVGVFEPGFACLPFFTMEYILGARSLVAYANEMELNIDARLKLFVTICEAVHYMHQKGVIHRDLKPGNILIDNDGRAKIIDFGIARTMDSDTAVTTMHTDAGQFIGTLAYMSPEQCAADLSQIDTTTDVYSLGVILFELLTGRLPYNVSRMSIHAAVRAICEQMPARPSTLNRSVRGNLEAIIMKAIEKDRANRYSSAATFAEDIGRYLRKEPINALPLPTWLRAVQWTVRRPYTTLLFIFILLLAAAWAAITLWK